MHCMFDLTVMAPLASAPDAAVLEVLLVMEHSVGLLSVRPKGKPQTHACLGVFRLRLPGCSIHIFNFALPSSITSQLLCSVQGIRL